MSEVNKSIIDRLISESKSGISLIESTILPGIKLSSDDIDTIVNYIVLHADFTAYHLLFVLRRNASDAYHRLPHATKARVLCEALAHQDYFNDWGYLDPSGSYDGEAAQALLALGSDALQPLLAFLDNSQPASLFGSEEATISKMYQYRLKDFAYRYLSLIAGHEPKFDADPQVRDVAIERLKSQFHSRE